MRFVKGLRIVVVPLGIGCSSHVLYIKEHNSGTAHDESGSIHSNAIGKTLFVGNIDYGLDMSHTEIDGFLRDMFQSFGTIENISISSFKDDDIERKKTRFAHVVFAKRSALKASLSAGDQIYDEIGKIVAKSWGIADSFTLKSVSEIRKSMPFFDCNIKELKEDVNQYMREYEDQEEMNKLEMKVKSRQADDDGFITVNTKTKRQREEERGSGSKRSRSAKKETELRNFYRYQVREEKREKLEELRRKFDEDKAKVATMKAARKFNPFK